MTGFPLPTNSNKWMGVPEAKHPLIQDLIRIWEESPGYILPQESFIKDKKKLEALIDSLIEQQKNKNLVSSVPRPTQALAPKPPAEQKDKEAQSEEWQKSLASALAMTKVHAVVKKDSKLPEVPAMPDLTKIPGASEKLAKLKIVDPLVEIKKEAPKGNNTHLIILYAISLSAFILALYALKR